MGAIAAPSAGDRRHLLEVVLHLARRQLRAAHRMTLLGWAWPVLRQLAQLGVLVFIFGEAFDIGIEDYAVFVFTGLVLWSWFSAAVTTSTTVLLQQRHLVLSPRFPALALPLVATAVALVDVVMALPVLLAMLAFEGLLHPAILLLPVVVGLLFAFTAGVSLLVAALNVFLRDVQSLVSVLLLLFFYLTPIFYGLKVIPERFQWVIELNPLTHFVVAARDVCIEGRAPGLDTLALCAALAAVALALGVVVFRRLQPDFVDAL